MLYCYSFSYAEHVSLGDEVLVQGNVEFRSAKVIQVSSSVKQGSIHLFLLAFLTLVIDNQVSFTVMTKNKLL